MSRQIPIDRNESNPMLMGYLELVKEDAQAMQQKQKDLNQAMENDPEMVKILEMHKKAAEEMQAMQQKQMGEMMKENPAIMELMEKHKKEVAELQSRQRSEVEDLMRKDEDIAEAMKKQQKELQALQIMQQQMMNQKVMENDSLTSYVNDVKSAHMALQENQQMFEKEMFKAVYMVPVKIDPEPFKDSEGELQLTPGSKLSIQLLKLNNQKGVIMAFTDVKEYKKWTMADKSHTISMPMKEMAAAVMKDSNMAGIAINPFSDNIVLPKERIEKMVRSMIDPKAGKNGKNVEIVEADINE